MNIENKTKKQLISEIKSLRKKLSAPEIQNKKSTDVEKKLEESEEKFRNLFQKSNDSIFIHDIDGNIIEVNKKALNQLGYRKSEIINLKIWELHPKESFEESKSAFLKINKDGHVQFEIHFLKKNGQTFPAEVSSSIFEMQGKKVVQGIVRDISERKKAEQRLEESERNLNSIIKGVPDIIYRLDIKAKITFISETVKEYGYEPEELIGKSVFSLVYPGDRDKAKWRVNERRTGERRTKAFEIRMLNKNREVVPFDVRARDIQVGPVFLLEAEGVYSTDQPQAISFLGSQGIARDITERKLAENALKESEEKFRSIVENSHVGIGIIDDNFKLIYVNDMLLKILRMPRKSIAGKDFRSLLDKKNRDYLADRYLRRQRGEDIPTTYVINLKDGKGNDLILELKSSVVVDSLGTKKTIVQILNITESKKAERSIAESENKYRQLFQNANDAIYLWEVKDAGNVGRCIEVNDMACQMLGYGRSELLQMTPKELDAPEKINEISKIIKTIKDKQHYTFEMIHVAKNGHRIPVEINSHLFNLNGKKVILSITRDITERKKAEKALIESENRFRTVFTSAAWGIAISDRKGVLKQTNPSFQDMLGYSEKELTGKTLTEITFVSDRRESLSALQKLKYGEENQVHLEKRHICKDGKIVWGNVMVSAIRDEKGKLEYTIALIENITDRKKAEQALKDSETKFRNVINHAPVVVWAIDKNGIFTFSEGRGLATLGLKPGEVVGKSLFAVYHHNKKIITDAKRALRGESFISKTTEENLIFETRFSPLYDEKGKINGVTGVSTDITESIKSDEVLKGKSIQQQQLLETARQLTASLNQTDVLTRIAHEANNMMRAHGCVIYLLEADKKTMRPVVAIDPQFEKEILSTTITVDNSFSGQAVKDKKGIIFNEAGEDRGGYQIPGTPEEEEEHIIVSPFVVNDEVLGVICLDRVDEYFTEEELALTETFATYAATALKNARAHHDLMREIEERKLTQKALEESEEKFRNLAEQSPNMIFINVNGKIVYANQKCEEMMGYSRKELYSPEFNFLCLIAPESLDVIKKNFKKHMQGLDISPYEYTLIKKSGSRIESLITTKLINYGGEHGILGIITDIGQQKRAEEALKVSEEKYRRFFEEDLTGDFTATDDGKLLACNSAYLRIFGFNSEEEAFQNNIFKLFPSQEVRKELLELLTKESILEYHEMELRRFDSKPVYVIANILGKLDENDQLCEISGYFFDDTERKILEQQFRQAQKMEAVGRLAGGVAHDFNNLLTIVNGYSDLILHRLDKENPLNKDIRQIKQAGEKATRLTNQLLAFSRRQVMQPKLLNLNGVVMDVEKMLRRLIGEDVELVITLDPSIDSIKADPGQLEQVIMNLAINARDAMPKGGRLLIETEMMVLESDYYHKHIPVQPAGEYVTIAISDNGIGMDEETKSQIFEPFFTTKERGKGTGLGLSTVYGIIKQSGGYIWVESKPGEGATFTIYFLPVLESSTKVPQKIKTKESYIGTETILLVEDEVMVRELAKRILSDNGYKVIEATRGDEALEISKKFKSPIDLMVTDVVMPGMSGKELAKQLRPLRPKMKILFISGYTDEVMNHKGKIEEDTEFLQKPFVPDTLLKIVRRILDQMN
jgi:PAS domain S-box-containing protein